MLYLRHIGAHVNRQYPAGTAEICDRKVSNMQG